MRRKGNKKYRYGKGGGCKAAVLFAMAVIVVCSSCTKKEALQFSLQNMEEEGELTEEGSGTGSQIQTPSPESEDASEDREVSDENQTAAGSDIGAAAQTDALSAETAICVHVCGAVNKPGVYELPAGSRVYEAIQAAGGFTEEADEDYVNQAQQLPDAVQLIIPTVDQVAALEQEGGQADTGKNDAETDTDAFRIGMVVWDDLQQESVPCDSEQQNVFGDASKVNINTATEAQLCDIPGIGAVRASAIVSYRQEHGAFERIEDIMKVSGIKQSTYDKLKDSIRVN